MKVIAHTLNGMNQRNSFEVKLFSVWINKVSKHEVNEISLDALLNDIIKYNKVTYTASNSCVGSSPEHNLAGQHTVIKLTADNQIVWEK